MRLIGLNGRAGAGKDTAVKYIRECTTAEVARVGIMDKMKLSFLAALGYDYDPADIDAALNHANLIKEYGFITTVFHDPYVDYNHTKSISGRTAQQRYGDEAHRSFFGEDFWLDALLPRPGNFPTADVMRHRFPGVDVLCISDVRLPNEAKRILNLGGEVWQIDAEQRLGPLPPDSHRTEHPLPRGLVTHIVKNNTTLEQFETGVKLVWELSSRG